MCADSLVVGEGIPADAPLEDVGRVRILFDRAEVEHPVVFAVATLEEADRVLSAVPVEAFDTGCRIAHDDDLVCHIDEVCGVSVSEHVYQKVMPDIPSSTLSFESRKRDLSPETSRRM